jgi:hypothetical protein
MRVPFVTVWRKRNANGSGISAISTDSGGKTAGEPVSADQATLTPLPRRQPGSYGVKAVKADPAAANLATLRKILDRLNRI